MSEFAGVCQVYSSEVCVDVSEKLFWAMARYHVRITSAATVVEKPNVSFLCLHVGFVYNF